MITFMIGFAIGCVITGLICIGIIYYMATESVFPNPEDDDWL